MRLAFFDGQLSCGAVGVYLISDNDTGGEEQEQRIFVPFRVHQNPYFQLVGKTKLFWGAGEGDLGKN